MNLYKVLLPPTHANLELSHKAGFLHFTLIIITFAFLVFGLLNLGWGSDKPGVYSPNAINHSFDCID